MIVSQSHEDSLLRDLFDLPSKWRYLAYATWIRFVSRYRRTAIGPLWIIVSPLLFISLVGTLFSQVNGIDPVIFIPHITVGYIVWMLLLGITNSSAALFIVFRPDLLQGGSTLADVAARSMLYWIFQFVHHFPIIILCLVVFRPESLPKLVYVLPLLLLIICNGMWVTLLLGILGSRYRDIREIVESLMRIMFLCTPIIWMPGTERSRFIDAFLFLNPFYHFIHLLRAPVLDQPYPVDSLMFVLVFTGAGFLLTGYLYRRYMRYVPIWL